MQVNDTPEENQEHMRSKRTKTQNKNIKSTVQDTTRKQDIAVCDKQDMLKAYFFKQLAEQTVTWKQKR